MRRAFDQVTAAHPQRDRDAVAQVALALAAGRQVDGDDQRLVARRVGAGHEARVRFGVAQHVQLEPQAPRHRLGELLDADRGHRGEHERNPVRGGGAGERQVRARPRQRARTHRRDDERRGGRPPEDLGGQVRRRHVDEHARDEAQPLERRAIFGKRQLVLGAAVDELEHQARQPTPGEATQVLDRNGARQRALEAAHVDGLRGDRASYACVSEPCRRRYRRTGSSCPDTAIRRGRRHRAPAVRMSPS